MSTASTASAVECPFTVFVKSLTDTIQLEITEPSLAAVSAALTASQPDVYLPGGFRVFHPDESSTALEEGSMVGVVFVDRLLIADEFLVFLEQFRDDSYGYQDQDFHALVEACNEKSRQAGCAPVIRYFDESHKYFRQIRLFMDYIRGDSIVGVDGQSALDVTTNVFRKCHTDVCTDSFALDFYRHLVMTVDAATRDRLVEEIVHSFTSRDLSTYECSEDVFYEESSYIAAFLLHVLESTGSTRVAELFHDIPLIDEDGVSNIYDTAPINLTERDILSILRYDLEDARSTDSDAEDESEAEDDADS